MSRSIILRVAVKCLRRCRCRRVNRVFKEWKTRRGGSVRIALNCHKFDHNPSLPSENALGIQKPTDKAYIYMFKDRMYFILYF